jgi:hypothetical protein
MTDFFKAIAALAGALAAIVGLATATGFFDPKVEADTGDGVVVANVYNLPDDRGLAYIARQGFTNVRVIQVCSNSVSAGRIREVLLDNGASTADETTLVGPGGSEIKIPLSTKLLVKVSNGNACS